MDRMSGRALCSNDNISNMCVRVSFSASVCVCVCVGEATTVHKFALNNLIIRASKITAKETEK